MKIEMQFGDTPTKLSFSKWDFAFVGKAIDERGNQVLDFIRNNANQLIYFEYVPKEFKIKLDELEFDKDDLSINLENVKGFNILIDSTTLNFAEILILTHELKNIGLTKLSIMYVEPKNYKRKSKSLDILHKRDFELSASINGYEAIPGHALLVSNEISQKVVFLCGFEAERIDRALEDSQIDNTLCSCIFGVPAYVSGWEMDSFDNNIYIIKERKLSGGVNFCGATNPLSVFQTLENIYNGLEDDQQMFVAPLATKPMNVGACLFLISKPKDRVAVLYDHPSEIPGKAIEIANWHLFNINLS